MTRKLFNKLLCGYLIHNETKAEKIFVVYNDFDKKNCRKFSLYENNKNAEVSKMNKLAQDTVTSANTN